MAASIPPDLLPRGGVTTLGVFDAIGPSAHEEVLFGTDSVSGLKTIVAIHSTALGPALGGTRFFPYQSEASALHDVLRLSQAMSYKAAAAGLDLGGGKAVVIGDPDTNKSERLLRSYGRVVDSLGGRYITAEDIGTTASDMVMIRRETRWVAGIPESYGGSGDPSPATARGVIAAMHTVAQRLWGEEGLDGRTVAVLGVGKVGSNLVERLTKAGAATVVADINPAATRAMSQRYGSRVVPVDEIYDEKADILAPCAMGGVLTEHTIPRLRCEAVVGSANNQLANETDADLLGAHNILYAPDFVVNAGGIINIAEELSGYAWERAAIAVDRVSDNLERVLRRATEGGVNPHAAALNLAKDRIATIGALAARRRGRQSANPERGS